MHHSTRFVRRSNSASPAVTRRGRQLRAELNDAIRTDDPDHPYIPLDRLGDVSLLARRVARYNTRQEQACSYEWACGEKWDRDEERLEQSIRDLAKSLPGVLDVVFSGDPRGYTVKLVLSSGRTNCWGQDGWGIG